MEQAFLKCRKVIESCKTYAHLDSASKMVYYFDILFTSISLTNFLKNDIYVKSFEVI